MNGYDAMEVNSGSVEGAGKEKPLRRKVQFFIPLYVGILSLLVIIPGSFIVRTYGPDVRINYTPSMPKGLYRIKPLPPAITLHKGDIILYPVPEEVEAIIYGRHYLRRGVPLMKPIAALAGDKVCIDHHTLTINQVAIGRVFDVDSNGEVIPHKEGCYILKAGQILPISTYYERSFDGRYHGPISKKMLIGIAEPLLIWR